MGMPAAAAGLVVLPCLAMAAAPAARAPAAEPPALRCVESVSRSLRLRSGDVEVADLRRFRLDLRLPFDAGAGTLPPETRIAFRHGSWTFDRRLMDGRGRARAGSGRISYEEFPVPGDGALPARVLVLVRWGDGALRVQVRGTGAAPVGEGLLDAPAGASSADLASTVVLGDATWRLAGSAALRLRRRQVGILGETVELVGLRLSGAAALVGEEADVEPPVVVVTSPVSGKSYGGDAITVAGTLRDGWSLAGATVSAETGAAVPLTLDEDADPDTLGGRLAVFARDFDTSTFPSGRLSLTVHATDDRGNRASATVAVYVHRAREVVIEPGWYGPVAGDGTRRARHWGLRRAPPPVGAASDNLPAPTLLPGLEKVVDLAVGDGHALALVDGGIVMAWGKNDWGQCGDGHVTDRPVPFRVPGLTGIVDVAAGQRFSLALDASGTVWAWGANDARQLGHEPPPAGPARSTLPVAVAGLPAIRALAASQATVFGLDDEGDVWCWGLNGAGQLGVPGPGVGGVQWRAAPAVVPGVTGALSVAAFHTTVYAVLPGGALWGWGDSTRGQLQTPLQSNLPPMRVAGVTDAVAAAAGLGHVLVLRADGTVVARGRNIEGQVGNGSTADPVGFAAVPGLTGVRAVAAGALSSYAVLEDGSVRAWGDNSQAQVGDGSTTGRTSPVPVELEPAPEP